MLLLNSSRDALLGPLQSVSGIVEKRHTLPILSNVLIEKQGDQLTLLATDIEIQIKTSAVGAGGGEDTAITVGARKLQDILRALPESADITLSLDDKRLTVKAGRSRFQLQTLPAADYPRLTAPEDQGVTIRVPQKVFKHQLAQVAYSMAQQDIRYYLNGLLMMVAGNALRMVATDGHRLAFAESQLEGEYQKTEVILPRKTVLELQRLLADDEAPIEIRFAANQAKFAFGSMEFVSKLVEGKFPDYNRVIPRNHPNHITLGRAPLLASLQRAAILTSEKFKGVRLGVEPGMLKIAASNAEQEEAQEELEIDYDGPAIDIGFNVGYLTDALANIGAEMVTIELLDGQASALFTVPEQPGFKYVVMPMRI